jgi:hypothetical protein
MGARRDITQAKTYTDADKMAGLGCCDYSEDQVFRTSDCTEHGRAVSYMEKTIWQLRPYV